MNVLSIDSSHYVLGIALINEEKVIGETITNIKKNHSVRVMPAIEKLLLECELTPKDLNKIVVAHGPGSYTGVRIGVTIAKSIAWSLQIPLVGISSLQVVAGAGRFFNGLICPLFDARRGQVFTGLYKYVDDTFKVEESDRLMLIKDLIEKIKNKKSPTLFIGNDVSIHQQLLEEGLGEQAHFATIPQLNPRPSELAYFGLHEEGVSGEQLHAFVPQYLRLAEAEAKWREGQENAK